MGLTVAIMVHISALEGHPLGKAGTRFMVHMGGVYFWTAIIKATRSLPLVQYLKLDEKLRADPCLDEHL